MNKEDWGDPIEMRAPMLIDYVGCVVVGRYLGSTLVHHREDDRTSKIHSVVLADGFADLPDEFKDGEEIRFWGSYDLDEKLRRVRTDHSVRIEYTGKEKLSGAREMKIFEVRLSKKNGNGQPVSPCEYDETNPPPPEDVPF